MPIAKFGPPSFFGEWLFRWPASILFKNMKTDFFHFIDILTEMDFIFSCVCTIIDAQITAQCVKKVSQEMVMSGGTVVLYMLWRLLWIYLIRLRAWNFYEVIVDDGEAQVNYHFIVIENE